MIDPLSSLSLNNVTRPGIFYSVPLPAPGVELLVKDGLYLVIQKSKSTQSYLRIYHSAFSVKKFIIKFIKNIIILTRYVKKILSVIRWLLFEFNRNKNQGVKTKKRQYKSFLIFLYKKLSSLKPENAQKMKIIYKFVSMISVMMPGIKEITKNQTTTQPERVYEILSKIYSNNTK